MAHIPQPNEIYRHFKGNLYRVLTIATHSETREKMVVYQALYGSYENYVRNLEMFMSKVDREKYPDADQEYRFQLIPAVAMPETGATAGQAVVSQTAAGQAVASQTAVEQAVDGQATVGQTAVAGSAVSDGDSHTETNNQTSSTEQALNAQVADSQMSEAQVTDVSQEEDAINPLLLEFLDAETYKEKRNLLVAMRDKITDDMINTMAIALDLEIAEGKLEDRYEALKNCIVTLEKYECSRLR